MPIKPLNENKNCWQPTTQIYVILQTLVTYVAHTVLTLFSKSRLAVYWYITLHMFHNTWGGWQLLLPTNHVWKHASYTCYATNCL